MRYFFVSYAHVPDDNNDKLVETNDDLVRTFARKLEVEVTMRAGKRGGEVGFIDTTSLRAGDAWEPTLARAVATCSVFILLYSPLYFESPWCSAEWQAFELRLTGFRPDDPPAPLLIPLFWIPTKPVDPRLGRYQLTDTRFGAAYAAHGLRRLVQLRDRDYEADYLEFLDTLAARIVDVSREYSIPAHPDPMGLMAQARQKLAAADGRAVVNNAASGGRVAVDGVVPTRPDHPPPTGDPAPANQSGAGSAAPGGTPRQRPRPILSSYIPEPKTDTPGERSDNGDD